MCFSFGPSPFLHSAFGGILLFICFFVLYLDASDRSCCFDAFFWLDTLSAHCSSPRDEFLFYPWFALSEPESSVSIISGTSGFFFLKWKPCMYFSYCRSFESKMPSFIKLASNSFSSLLYSCNCSMSLLSSD